MERENLTHSQGFGPLKASTVLHASRLLLALAPLLVGSVIQAQPAPRAAAPGLVAVSERATAAMNDGRYDEAVRLYREMLKTRPADAGLSMNLGIALAMAGREDEAIAPLTKAIGLRPSLIPAHLFLGSSYLALGQPERAVAPLERAVAARPADVESLGLLAQARLAAGDVARASTAFRRLTEMAPALPAAWYGLGQTWNALAQQALESFAAEPPDSPWRALLVADALREDGRFNEAFGAYRALATTAPSPRRVQEALASIYEKTGHADWAKTARARAAATPVDCVAHKAECDVRAGRHRSALTATTAKTDQESRYWRVRAATALTHVAFAKLEALPDSQERREMRAELARAENRHADSVTEIQAALTFAPDDPRLLEELATSHFLARDYGKAANVVKALLSTQPDSPSLLALHGETLLELQQLDAAIPALERAVALDASDGAARIALGRARVLAGRYADAIPLLEPVLADDTDGTLHFQLARAYQGVGQAEKAKPLLETYQELQKATSQRATGSSEVKITPP